MFASCADAGLARFGRFGRDRNLKPIDIIMACEAGRISIGEWSKPGSNRRPPGCDPGALPRREQYAPEESSLDLHSLRA
jgi:hypothetical protein